MDGVPKIPLDGAELEEVVEEDFSPEFLKHYLETDDLSSVKYVEMEVDADVQSIEAIGIHLPNVELLKLTGSHIPCVRDLGSHLQNLRVVWLTRVGLSDLDGIGVLDSLRELYVAFNHLTDLSPLMYHELEVLDLEGNCFASIQDVCDTLASCMNLRTLNIQNNPCSKQLTDLSKLKAMLPSLEVLNDGEESALDVESTNCSTQNLNDLLDGCEMDEQELIVFGIKKSRRVPTGSSLSARPSTAHPNFRPPSRGKLPTTAPAGGRPHTSLCSVQEDCSSASSSLTTGPPLAGNALRAVQAGRRGSERTEPESIEDLLERFHSFTPESVPGDGEVTQPKKVRKSDARLPTPDVRIQQIKAKIHDECLPRPTRIEETSELLIL